MAVFLILYITLQLHYCDAHSNSNVRSTNTKERVSEIRTNSSVRCIIVTADDIDTSHSIWLSMSEVTAVQSDIFTRKRGVKQPQSPGYPPSPLGGKIISGGEGTATRVQKEGHT